MGALYELRKAIYLCAKCAPKFNYRRHRYYKEKRWQVMGTCDARCGASPGAVGHFFVPEEFPGVSWGKP